VISHPANPAILSTARGWRFSRSARAVSQFTGSFPDGVQRLTLLLSLAAAPGDDWRAVARDLQPGCVDG